MWKNVIYLLPQRNQNNFPVDIYQKTEPSPESFTNQLFQLINLMAGREIDYGKGYERNCFDVTWFTYVDLFRTDHTTGDMVLSSSIFDFDKMNRLYEYNFYDIIYLDSLVNTRNWYFSSVFAGYNNYRNLFSVACNEIHFNEIFYEIGRKISKDKFIDNKEVNLAHIRIGNNFKNLLDSYGKINQYYELVENYYNTIVNNFDIKKPLCILVDDTEHELMGRLGEKFKIVLVTKDDVNKYLPPHFKDKYDILALCDITWSMSLNIDKFCYQENPDNVSSFSVFLKTVLDFKTGYSV